MSRYISADLKRIIRCVPYWICMVLLVAYLIVKFIIGYLAGWNAITFQVSVSGFTSTLPIFFGLLVFIAVFSVDIKAKTMQVAIGTGLSRAEVVLSKFAEVCIVTVAGIFMFIVLTFMSAVVTGAGISASQFVEILKYFLTAAIQIMGYNSIAMIILFATQSPLVGTLSYLALSTYLVIIALSFLLELKIFKGISFLSDYFFSELVIKAGIQFVLGTFNIGCYIGILAYIAGAVAVTVLLFRKRELEF